MSVITYPNLSISILPVPENETNLKYDYHFNTRTGLLGGKDKSQLTWNVDFIYLLFFPPRFSDPVHDREHPLHQHPDRAEDEEEEDHHLVHAPDLGRLLGHSICYSRSDILTALRALTIVIIIVVILQHNELVSHNYSKQSYSTALVGYGLAVR